MHKFQEEYLQAVERELPEFHMDSETVRSELHHRRMRVQQSRRIVVKGCTAAAVFVLLGAGTVAAKSYMTTMIEMRENGYVISDSGREKEILLADDRAEKEVAGGAKDEAGAEEGIAVLDDFAEEIPIEEAEYESLSEFLQKSVTASKIPDLSLLQSELGNGRVSVMEDDMTIFVHVTGEGRSFCLRQSDYRSAEGFSAATAYGGENANERNLTSAQGLNYTVFDTVDENGAVEMTHAVIIAEGRELSMDFSGFEPEVIEAVLTELNLELYFQ